MHRTTRRRNIETGAPSARAAITTHPYRSVTFMETCRTVLRSHLLFLALALSAAPASAEGDGTVFTDRFAAGIHQALVDDQSVWWRRGGEIRVEVPCAQRVEVQVRARPELGWTFAFDPLPAGVEAIGSGRLAVELACGGPDARTTVTASSASTLDDAVVLALAPVAGPPQPPTLDGIDLSGSGSVDIVNASGVLTPDLAWVEDFPLTVEIEGDADSFSSSLGSVVGTEWTFQESNGGPYSMTAHRDGLTDTGEGSLALREAVVTHLGATPVQVVGSERVVSKELACGEEYVGSFMTNTADLVPGVGSSYSSATMLPNNSSLTPDGVFSYTPSCAPGSPENVLFLVDSSINSQGINKFLDQVLVDIDVTGVSPSGLEIFGLDYTLDGQVNNQFDLGENKVENEVPYFCDSFSRNMRIISDDLDNTTYTILSGGEHAIIDDTNRLRLFTSSNNYSSCDVSPVIDSNGNVSTPGGLENVVVIEATSPLGSKTFSVDTRAYSPMISHVRVEPGQTSGGSPRDPYVAQFDSNKFSEMINLSYDRIPGQPHRMYLEPVISHDAVSLMRPSRSYAFEHNNQPFWMSLDIIDGRISASPTASDAGFVFPLPSYTIRVGGTQGPGSYKFNITVDDSL